MSQLESEISECLGEVDEMLSDPLTLIDSDERNISVVGSVGEFMTSRTMDARNNVIQVRSAHVVLFRKSNANLSEILAASDSQAIPNGWQFLLGEKKYRVCNASSDELAFEFDIQHGIT